MRYLGFILVLLIALSSCDSREDWFEKNSEFPDLIVDINGHADTIRQGEMRKISIDLRTVRIKRGMIFTDTAKVTIKGFYKKGNYPMDGINIDGLTISGGRNFEVDENNNVHTQLYDVFESYDYVLYKADVTSFLLNTYHGQITVYDKFYNGQTYTIEINIYGPNPPTPVLKIEKLAGGYEYNLSLENSYDLDGKATKYEWCIDGNIVPYSIDDCRFESREGNWQSGKAAYGGTYITATSLSSVNHSFQTAGEHTVYYRCMDDMGIWSMWYSKKINVE